MDTKPTDLITQSEASVLVGRGVDTIRRWRRDKGLQVWRDVDGDHTAPAMVSRTAVLELAKAVSPQRTSDKRRAGQGEGAYRDLQAHLATMEASLNSERQARAELHQLSTLLQVENERLRAEIIDKTRRIDALEEKMHKGVSGLLSGVAEVGLSGAAKIGRRFFR